MTKQDTVEEKKVEFAFDVEKLNEEAFLNKLQTAVKRIDDYKVHLGMDKGERTMKLQGVMPKDCKLDLTKHFSKPDYVAER